MVDLDKLEALAKASADHGENIGEESWYVESEYVCNMLMHPIDAVFAEACTPAVILALIAEVRALRADAARYDFLRSRAELRQYEMGYYWYIKTVDVPMGMPPMAATLANVIDCARGAK
ncbi:hypothetical protein [Paraburkholderia atlantica]|uniref:hypothetical protein n=1 Tax=Paraburkholderia atlantica TaxID=2654982 RepID=UPI001617EAE5|nr:hypothetical protein [Paraburkholderia atlantica]MBB5414085.1 hypothetical protein [Paraburkholderia atlantica]